MIDSLLYANAQRHDPMGDGTRPSSLFDPKGKGRATPQNNGDILALDLGSAEEGLAPNGDAFMQMQLVEQQVSANYVLDLTHLAYHVSLYCRIITSNRVRPLSSR